MGERNKDVHMVFMDLPERPTTTYPTHSYITTMNLGLNFLYRKPPFFAPVYKLIVPSQNLSVKHCFN